MPFFKSLLREAQHAAETARGKCESLHQEILDLEQRKAEKQAALELARTAVQRFDSFEPDIDGNLRCPDCWVSRGVESTLIPIPSDTSDDLFRCKTCHLEISIEA